MTHLALSLLPLAALAALVPSAGCGPADAALETSASAASGAPASWAHPYRGDVQIDGITSDASNAVYAAGYYVGHADFGPGAPPAPASVPSGGGPTKDIFVTRHERDGALAWVKTFGGPGLEGNVYDLVASPEGAIVLSGAFSGAVTFGDYPLTATAEAGSGNGPSGTYGNAFLAALEPDGSTRWAYQATGDVVSGGNEVAPHPAGGVVQVGIYGGTKDAGGHLRIDDQQVAFTGGYFDTYVARFDPGGHPRWLRSVTGSAAQRGKGIAADPEGSVVVVGDAWDGTTRFAPGESFTSAGPQERQDFWVARYSPGGDLRWFRSFASEGLDEAKGVAVDQEGNVVVGASFSGRSIQLLDQRVEARPGATETGVIFSISQDGKRARVLHTITSVVNCCELELDARGHLLVSNHVVGPSVRLAEGGPFSVHGSPSAGLLTELRPDGQRVGAWAVQATASEFNELSVRGDGAVAVAASFRGASLTLGNVTVTGGAGRTQAVVVIGR